MLDHGPEVQGNGDGALVSLTTARNWPFDLSRVKLLSFNRVLLFCPQSFFTSARSVNDCHFECINNSACTAFTFEEGVGCYLYDGEESTLARYPDNYPTAISGIAKCGESDGEEGSCYQDSIIEGASFYAFNASECASRCSEVPSCMNWTYDPRKRYESCTFHRSGAKKATCIGTYSGSKPVHAGTYGFYRYEAPSILVPNVESAALCRAHCAENNMQYWTFLADGRCLLHDEGNYKRVPDPYAVCGTVEDPLE